MNDSIVARSWLFVPGSRPERFAKAVSSGAEAVILDLEDSVLPDDKIRAREAAGRWLAEGGRGWVRINATGTPLFTEDLERLVKEPGLVGLVVPKVEEPAAMLDLREILPPGVLVLGLIESATGILRAAEIAATGSMARLAFGSVDFALDIGTDEASDTLLWARSALILASRAGGLPPPVDGVTTAVDDAELVGQEARSARALGFGGKLCIHPAQLAAVHEAFSPSQAEVNWARAVVAASGSTAGGSFQHEGHMIDRPVIERARAFLAQFGDGDGGGRR